MTKGGRGLTVALIASLLLPLLLSACGSSDSGSSSTETSGTAANSSLGPSANAQGGSKTRDSAQGKGAQGNKDDRSQKSDSRSHSVATPLKVSGGGSGQYRSPGGDNSVQNFGEESDETELQEAAEALHGFYVARAKGEWARGCGYLERGLVTQLERLAAQSPKLRGKGCAAALDAFTSRLPAPVLRETTVIDAGSLRREGERAFLIYRDAEKTIYAIPMQEEGGAWKVGLLVGTPLG